MSDVSEVFCYCLRISPLFQVGSLSWEHSGSWFWLTCKTLRSSCTVWSGPRYSSLQAFLFWWRYVEFPSDELPFLIRLFVWLWKTEHVSFLGTCLRSSSFVFPLLSFTNWPCSHVIFWYLSPSRHFPGSCPAAAHRLYWRTDGAAYKSELFLLILHSLIICLPFEIRHRWDHIAFLYAPHLFCIFWL